MQNPNYVQYPRFQEKRVRFEALNEAFSHFGKDWQLYVVATLPIFLLMIPYFGYTFYDAFNSAGTPPTPEKLLTSNGLSVVFNLIEYLWLAALVQLAVLRIDGKPAGPFDGFKNLPIGPIFVAMILSGILITVGFCLCIVPGLMALGLFLITFPLISDRRMGPIEAMGASYDAVKPHMWTAVGLYFVASLVMGLSVVLCGVGILAGMPIMALTIAITYRDLFPLDPQSYAPPVGTV